MWRSLNHLSYGKIARLSSISLFFFFSIIFPLADIHTSDCIMLLELHIISYNISNTNMSTHRINNGWLITVIQKVQWTSHTSILVLLNKVGSKWVSKQKDEGIIKVFNLHKVKLEDVKVFGVKHICLLNNSNYYF